MKNDPTVFLIEDDIELCNAIKWLLRSVNITTEIYHNGLDYLNSYEAVSHGCILIDIRMPVMGGFELLAELNKKNNNLPVIFITGHGDVQMAVRAMQGGAIDFILKPFHDELLLEKIQKAMARDGERERLAENLNKEKVLLQLTPRELEVIECIVEGRLNKQISAELDITISTVEFHRANIMRKLKAKNAAELVKIYMQNK